MTFLVLQMVTIDNAEDYVDFMFDFCMQTGVQKQMEAFRSKHCTLETAIPQSVSNPTYSCLLE